MKHVNITRNGRISTVEFDRGNPANPLSNALMRELTQAAKNFEEDTETSAVILKGRSDNFSLGFDLKDAETRALKDMPAAERRLALMVGGRMCQAWEDIQPLTIAAIEGWCVGGGVALAVSTDLRVASKTSTFYVPEVERGLNMSWGSVPRITNLVGPARAKRLIALAEQLEAARAEAWGLIDDIAPEGGSLATAKGWAERAAVMPPVALRMCKQSVNAYANALSGAVSAFDYDQFATALASDEAEEGIAAFLEKRLPDY